jgi:hypothetical protein
MVEMASLEAAQRNYENNIKKLPWNDTLAKQYNDASKRHNATITANLPKVSTLVEQEARNVSGAARQRNAARSAVDNALNQLRNLGNQISVTIGQIDIGGIQNRIRVVEDQIAAEKTKQNKAGELIEIRREQAASLEKKYASNYHSSWLGLWRPLKDESRVGLNVASVMFGILAVLTIGYMLYARIPAIGGNAALRNAGVSGTAALAAANNVWSGIMGGFRKAR